MHDCTVSFVSVTRSIAHHAKIVPIALSFSGYVLVHAEVAESADKS